jgi:hypothetical protein
MWCRGLMASLLIIAVVMSVLGLGTAMQYYSLWRFDILSDISCFVGELTRKCTRQNGRHFSPGVTACLRRKDLLEWIGDLVYEPDSGPSDT